MPSQVASFMRKTFGVMTQRAKSDRLAHLQMLSFRLNEIQYDTTLPRGYREEMAFISPISSKSMRLKSRHVCPDLMLYQNFPLT